MKHTFSAWKTGQAITLALALLIALATPLMESTLPGVEAAQGSAWRCVEISGFYALNIRGGAGTSFAVAGTRNPGDRMEADYARLTSADGYDWVPVRDGVIEGWAITARLDDCPAGASVEVGGDSVAVSGGESIPGVNRDGVLDRFEIAEIARRVVLVGAVEGGSLFASGTGTITSADGLILTNAHVIEGADEIAIAILDDINDPPEFRFLAEIVSVNFATDVALLAIRTDLDGRAVNTSALRLPYMPAPIPADEVFRGDAVYIFGFPGIGDDYLVVTSGSIVSVENGTVEGERIPVWYRTDAEIAPGNSGGLAVNGDGDFVGIPTAVRAESETGARLGGIRPAEVALLAVDDPGVASGLGGQPPQPVAPEAAIAPGLVTLVTSAVSVQHGAQRDGEAGMIFRMSFTLSGWAEQEAYLRAHFFFDDMASTPVTNPAAPPIYRSETGTIVTGALVLPCCEPTGFDNVELFLPYSALGLNTPGTYPLKVRLELVAANGAWQRVLSWEFISLTVG